MDSFLPGRRGLALSRGYLFIGLILIQVCSLPDPKELNRKPDLLGTWQAEHQGLYHTLYVQDSIHIALDTHLDTVFFLEYQKMGDSLILKRSHGRILAHHRILKLDWDSLILDGLLDRPGLQRYRRKHE